MNEALTTTADCTCGASESRLRRRWHVSGRVQGVGFRPLVFRLASEAHITGAVWNDAGGVVIEGQGTVQQLEGFAAALRQSSPVAAAVRAVVEETVSLCPDEKNFAITASETASEATAEAAADLAICAECVREIRDAGVARRYRYAFTNCTNCGPRFSIIRAIPYDRRNTTMAAFSMCGQCQEEYESITDRRFHAQPTACRQCGPSLKLVDRRGNAIAGDAIAGAATRLAAGKIVAVKGIGGYHLAARADNNEAVSRLRMLKHRPAKPFALMCGTVEQARKLVRLSDRGESLLRSAAAPIVLGERVAGGEIAAEVAPHSHRLGVMLPYTPLHQLLFDELQRIDVEVLVMTSGNDVDEPLIFQDEEAVQKLRGLCDAILLHNRPIERAVDDSVVIDARPEPILARRSRGYAPEPIDVKGTALVSPGLALGAEMKNTVAICRDGQAVLSQHLGNLTHTRTYAAFRRAIDDLCRLFTVSPRWIAHDLHPAYLSTHYARQLAAEWNVPLIGVQHHHAHAAAVLAEHGVDRPALAVVCDGTGFGPDGTIWGGEVLLADLSGFTRVARLRPIQLPGGDAAAKQPWRSALALLHRAFGDGFAELPVCSLLGDATQIEFVRGMLASGVSCVASSSTGRVFDGVAALLNICRENRFDAEAPAALEAAAAGAGETDLSGQALYTLHEAGGLIEIDLSPMVRAIALRTGGAAEAAEWAMRFHAAVAGAFSAAVSLAVHKCGIDTVALSGGAFCNELFGRLLGEALMRSGLRVLRHRAVPPNDGGIALGQIAVAASRMKQDINQP